MQPLFVAEKLLHKDLGSCYCLEWLVLGEGVAALLSFTEIEEMFAVLACLCCSSHRLSVAGFKRGWRK